MEKSNKPCCFSNTLKLIEQLQNNSNCIYDIDNTCIKPFLGDTPNIELYNTRPVTFYGCNNNLITVGYSTVINGETVTGTSSIFRVENVNNCCVTVSILIDNPDTTQTTIPYVATNSFFTMNLNCSCCLRCLPDTYVECI